MILENPSMGLEALKEKFNQEVSLDISISTLSKTLKSLGTFMGPTWTPTLTEKHKEARLDYWQNHLEKKSSFEEVIFSDESRFYINRNTKKVFVMKGGPHPQKQKKNPNLSKMVWGGITYESTLYLRGVEGNMDYERYIDVLNRYFQEALPNLNPKISWQFQQNKCISKSPTKSKGFYSG